MSSSKKKASKKKTSKTHINKLFRLGAALASTKIQKAMWLDEVTRGNYFLFGGQFSAMIVPVNTDERSLSAIETQIVQILARGRRASLNEARIAGLVGTPPPNPSPSNASPSNASPSNASPSNASPSNASPSNASPAEQLVTNWAEQLADRYKISWSRRPRFGGLLFELENAEGSGLGGQKKET